MFNTQKSHVTDIINQSCHPFLYPPIQLCLGRVGTNMGVSKSRVGGNPPKMDGLYGKTPIKMDDLGGSNPPLFLETSGP